jgi:isochorismate hydrolase
MFSSPNAFRCLVSAFLRAALDGRLSQVGQAHHKACAATGAAFRTDAAAVVVHDALADCQSHPHPFILGRIERIEQA